MDIKLPPLAACDHSRGMGNMNPLERFIYLNSPDSRREVSFREELKSAIEYTLTQYLKSNPTTEVND